MLEPITASPVGFVTLVPLTVKERAENYMRSLEYAEYAEGSAEYEYFTDKCPAFDQPRAALIIRDRYATGQKCVRVWTRREPRVREG
jgi:hypothetical protein